MRQAATNQFSPELLSQARNVILELEKRGYSSSASEIRTAFFPLVNVVAPFIKTYVAAKLLGVVHSKFGKFDIMELPNQQNGETWYSLGRWKQDTGGTPYVQNELLRTKSKYLLKFFIEILIHIKDLIMVAAVIYVITKIIQIIRHKLEDRKVKKFNEDLQKRKQLAKEQGTV